MTNVDELTPSGPSRSSSSSSSSSAQRPRPCLALLAALAIIVVLVPAVAAAALMRNVSEESNNLFNMASRSRSKGKVHLMCNTDSNNDQFWIRNACHDGFVTVRQGSVMAQHQRVDQHDDRVAIRKETCQLVSHDGSSLSPSPRLLIRLHHVESQRYICFNRRGKIRPMTKRRANRSGKLCAFYEVPVSSSSDLEVNESKVTDVSPSDESSVHVTYVQYRSAHRSSWLLGFNGRRVAVDASMQSMAHTRPRPMSYRSRARRPSRPGTSISARKTRSKRGRLRGRRPRRDRRLQRRRRKSRRLGRRNKRSGEENSSSSSRSPSSWLRHHRVNDASSCDFNFVTGAYESREWRGLIHRILDSTNVYADDKGLRYKEWSSGSGKQVS